MSLISDRAGSRTRPGRRRRQRVVSCRVDRHLPVRDPSCLRRCRLTEHGVHSSGLAQYQLS